MSGSRCRTRPVTATSATGQCLPSRRRQAGTPDRSTGRTDDGAGHGGTDRHRGWGINIKADQLDQGSPVGLILAQCDRDVYIQIVKRRTLENVERSDGSERYTTKWCNTIVQLAGSPFLLFLQQNVLVNVVRNTRKIVAWLL